MLDHRKPGTDQSISQITRGAGEPTASAVAVIVILDQHQALGLGWPWEWDYEHCIPSAGAVNKPVLSSASYRKDKGTPKNRYITYIDMLRISICADGLGTVLS